MYEQIDALRQADLLSEETATQMKIELFRTLYDKQLTAGMTALSNLASFQNSKNKEMAAVGKAAAIVQTTISMYQGATSAYAALSPIPYVGPALGIAAAAAAIAAGVANIAAINGVGFEQGGYTGDFGRQQVAGVVHGKEFVVNADATARNRDALEAMNRGAKAAGSSSSVGKSSGSGITVKIENYGTSKGFEVQQLSETDIRIIAKDEAKQAVYNHTPKVVASEIKNPNSMVSKSLERNTQAQRRRG
jgi:hypothetical protein